jgi:hypothetical protein
MPAQGSCGATSAVAHQLHTQELLWTTVAYSEMVLGTISAFLLTRGYGEMLVAPPAAPAEALAGAAAQPANVLLHILVTL